MRPCIMHACMLLALLAAVALRPAAASAADDRATLARLLDQDRAAAGLAPLARDPELWRAAQERAEGMARTGRLTHCAAADDDMAAGCPRSGYAALRLVPRAPWRWFGENFAWSTGGSPDQAEAWWMASPPHAANIRRPEFRAEGIGVACCAPTAWGPAWVAVQLFRS